MANRAYLYSLSENPETVQRKKLRIRSLSEWSWYIPLVFKILISGDTQQSRSLIWKSNKKIALIGNYGKGVQNLHLLIELLKKSHVQHPEVFQRVSREALQFLESKEIKQKFILLEPWEVLDVSDEIIEDVTAEVIDYSKDLITAINNNKLHELNKYVGDDLTTHWEDLLGIDYWTDILYFNINQN